MASYTLHNFAKDQTIRSAAFNEMDQQIQKNEQGIDALTNEVSGVKEDLTQTQNDVGSLGERISLLVGGKNINYIDATKFTTSNVNNWGLVLTKTSVDCTHRTAYQSGSPTLILSLPAGIYTFKGTFNTDGKIVPKLYQDGSYVKDLGSTTAFDVVSDSVYSIKLSSSEVGHLVITDMSITLDYEEEEVVRVWTKDEADERYAFKSDLDSVDSVVKAWFGDSAQDSNFFDATLISASNTNNWVLSNITKTGITITHNNTYVTGQPRMQLSIPADTYTFTYDSVSDNSTNIILHKNGSWLMDLMSGSVITIESGNTYTIYFSSSSKGYATFRNFSLVSTSGNSATTGKIAEIIDSLTESKNAINNISAEVKDVKSKSRKLNTPAIISFMDDDCRSEVYTILFPLIKSLGIPYTLACPPDDIGRETFMTHAQLDEMVEHGVSLSCHVDFRIDQVTAPEMEKLIKHTKKVYDEWGYTVPTYAYTNGKYSDENIRRVVMPNFKMGFLTKNGINKVPFHSYYMYRFGVISDTDFDIADAKAMVDRIAEDGGWLIFMTHAWLPYFISHASEEMPELVNYIRSKNVDIVDVNDALYKYGNQFETAGWKDDFWNKPYTIVDYTGRLWTNQITEIDLVNDDDNIGYKITSDGVVLLNLVNCAVINANGTVSRWTDNNYNIKVSEAVDVSDSTSVYVAGWASSTRLAYAFYDASGIFISGYAPNGSFKKTNVSVPSDAKYIRVAGNINNNIPYLKKVLR